MGFGLGGLLVLGLIVAEVVTLLKVAKQEKRIQNLEEKAGKSRPAD